MSPNSELNSLSFLFRHTYLDDEEQRQRELEKGDAKLDIEKNDLESPRRHDPCSDRPNET